MARRISHLVYASRGDGVCLLASGLSMPPATPPVAVARIDNLGGGYFRYVLAAPLAPAESPYASFPLPFGVAVTGAPDAGNNINQGLIDLSQSLDVFTVYNPAGVSAGAGGSAALTIGTLAVSTDDAAGFLATSVSLQVGRRYRISDISIAPTSIQGFTPSGSISTIGSLYLQQSDRQPFRDLAIDSVLNYSAYYAYLWSLSLSASIYIPQAAALANKKTSLAAISLQAEELTVSRGTVPVGHGVYIEGVGDPPPGTVRNNVPFEQSRLALNQQGIVDILPLSLQSYVPSGATEFVAAKPFLMIYPQLSSYPNNPITTPQTYVGRLRFSLEELS